METDSLLGFIARTLNLMPILKIKLRGSRTTLPTSKILGEAAIAPQCSSAESNTNAAALDSADQRTRPQGVDTALVPLEVAFFGFARGCCLPVR
jgi:hypothetical protein